MINVYFETDGYAEEVAKFEHEDLYIACLPTLEKKAKESGFTKVTESRV